MAVVYLVEGEKTLLSSQVDDPLRLPAPVFMLHPLSRQAEYRLA